MNEYSLDKVIAQVDSTQRMIAFLEDILTDTVNSQPEQPVHVAGDIKIMLDGIFINLCDIVGIDHTQYQPPLLNAATSMSWSVVYPEWASAEERIKLVYEAFIEKAREVTRLYAQGDYGEVEEILWDPFDVMDAEPEDREVWKATHG